MASDLLGPYKFKDVALPARGNTYWDGTTTHNPTIHKFRDKYYLYYTGNCGDGVNIQNTLNWTHRNSQRIGVAVASSPYGPWIRSDIPLIDVSSDSTAADALAVNNPSVLQRADGKIVMVYKAIAKKKPLPFGGPVVHLVALADSPTGPFVKKMHPVFTLENSFFAAEDPYIWYQDGRYYAIVKDMQGEFTKRGRSLALFTSEDGEGWQMAKHTFVSDLSVLWENGRRDSVAYLERPQLYMETESRKPSFWR
ncbi:MAG: glycoside hydrolase family protein, partial [Parabacteroides gordonii]|nr:glycoside hydrolase family protein [Parabacteroides gordonii]